LEMCPSFSLILSLVSTSHELHATAYSAASFELGCVSTSVSVV